MGPPVCREQWLPPPPPPHICGEQHSIVCGLDICSTCKILSSHISMGVCFLPVFRLLNAVWGGEGCGGDDWDGEGDP